MLLLVIGLIAVTALIGVAQLWPKSSQVPRAQNPYDADGTSLVKATITKVAPYDCNNGSTTGPDGTVAVKGDCANVTASTDRGTATFTLDSTTYVGTGMHRGDKVTLIRSTQGGVSWQFYDYRRGRELLVLSVLFAAAVVAVGRLRGLLSLVGVAVTVAVLMTFIVPALLAGKPALAVAVVGSVAIMIVVLYLAHGVSIRTTAALFGTFAGIVVTALLGGFMTGWANLTGVGSDDDRLLLGYAQHLSLSGVVAATMVIAGLGVLNDVTVTQASAVWEMRELQPLADRRRLFTSAMRIGRDHIASSVYTLVFAYAGSSMVVLLLIGAYHRSIVAMATTEEISQELVRTMVGAIGLVLAVPLTTLFAVWLAPSSGTEDGGGEPLARPGRRRKIQ